jgi:Fe-S-cluster-containing hydrogenase component 2
MGKISYFKCRDCRFSAKNPFLYCPQCQAFKSFDEKQIDDYSDYAHDPVQVSNKKVKNPRIFIDTDHCSGSTCALCKKACPADAIAVSLTVASVDSQKCIKCKRCIQECPNRAIYFTDSLKKALKCIAEGEKK